MFYLSKLKFNYDHKIYQICILPLSCLRACGRLILTNRSINNLLLQIMVIKWYEHGTCEHLCIWFTYLNQSIWISRDHLTNTQTVYSQKLKDEKVIFKSIDIYRVLFIYRHNLSVTSETIICHSVCLSVCLSISLSVCPAIKVYISVTKVGF